ncbi:MAG TPA: DUF1127 domain-containing protein [Stellaceae bacterium]|nr:DUF1127 domain-containing protein [Stellaceae bacterium]
MSSFISPFVTRVRAWVARERAFRELAALDDRSLADIGISRSEIPFVFDTKPAEIVTPSAQPVAANRNVRHAA